MLDLLHAAKDLGRLRDIASILARYGFADVVDRLGLSSALEKLGETLSWPEVENLAASSAPERVRRALEELGPTFVKLGQLLSTRVDLFSPEWIAEFERLQDEVAPLDFEALREQVEEDLGKPVDDTFATFEREPLASASIGQVHAATLADGQSVIIKIRRPGIDQLVATDLRLLARLAESASDRIEESRRFVLPQLVEQFRRSITLELDLATECRNAERLAANIKQRYGDHPPVVVPAVYWQWTGERMNVQSRVHGIPGNDLAALTASNLDGRELAKTGARVMLETILEDGFFHADPHPGNLFFLSDARIALIDFGMVGYLSERRREQFVGLLKAIVENDEEAVADMLLDLSGHARSHDGLNRLVEDVSVFLQNYHGVELDRLDIAAMLGDLFTLLRANQLVLPTELAQTCKVFVTLEGLGRRLDPSFNLVEQSAPVVKRAFRAFYSPAGMARRGQQSVVEILRVLSTLPRDVRGLVQTASSEGLKARVEMSNLTEFSHRLDRAASRLTVGMITAALIIGTAIAMTVDGGPRLFGLPFFGAIGFFGAGIAGTWVLISVLRDR